MADTSLTRARARSGRARELGARAYANVRELIERYGERDLLTYASAIAYQVLFALIPLALAALATLAFIGLEDVWTERVAPEARDALPSDAFSLVDRTVDKVLGEKRVFWLTGGLAFALWQLSGSLRAVSGALNEIYELEEDRSWVRRLVGSVLLALMIAPLLLAGTLSIAFGDRLVSALGIDGVAGFFGLLARWGLGVVCLLTAVWLVMRLAPAQEAAKRWVSLGSALTVGGWILTSLGYGLYLDHIASYQSIFGALAAVIVLMTYLYLLAVVFLGGAEVDKMAREHAGPGDDPA